MTNKIGAPTKEYEQDEEPVMIGVLVPKWAKDKIKRDHGNQSDYVRGLILDVVQKDLSDEELREKIKSRLGHMPVNPLEAIKYKLESLPGVEKVALLKNDSESIVNNMPPLSFEFVVIGGVINEIAEVIAATRPLGLAGIGNIEIEADEELPTVRFSRPDFTVSSIEFSNP